MSRKNHKMVNGQLLQMDKKYSQLKMKQREKIAVWMYEETLAYYNEHHRMPMGHKSNDIVDRVYERIEEAGIWIPYGEVHRQYIKKKTKVINRINKELGIIDQQKTK